jgi:hypothetical protein
MKFTEALVQNQLVSKTFPNHDIKIPNISCLYGWECDLVSVTKAGIVHEFEIKTTRSDWLAELRSIDKEDSVKKMRSVLLEHSQTVEQKIATGKERGWKVTTVLSQDSYPRGICRSTNEMPSPNYWWVCAPAGVVKPEEIPAYAGLIEYRHCDRNKGLVFVYAKTAPKLHKLKLSDKQWRALGRGAALRMWSLREKIDDR